MTERPGVGGQPAVSGPCPELQELGAGAGALPRACPRGARDPRPHRSRGPGTSTGLRSLALWMLLCQPASLSPTLPAGCLRGSALLSASQPRVPSWARSSSGQHVPQTSFSFCPPESTSSHGARGKAPAGNIRLST